MVFGSHLDIGDKARPVAVHLGIRSVRSARKFLDKLNEVLNSQEKSLLEILYG